VMPRVTVSSFILIGDMAFHQIYFKPIFSAFWEACFEVRILNPKLEVSLTIVLIILRASNWSSIVHRTNKMKEHPWFGQVELKLR
jgi:hypothetical protein